MHTCPVCLARALEAEFRESRLWHMLTRPKEYIPVWGETAELFPKLAVKSNMIGISHDTPSIQSTKEAHNEN